MKFSSGRLGHVWALVNGIALANKDKTIFMLGSDGSQQVRVAVSSFAEEFELTTIPLYQEGNDAEAARLAVAQNLNVKLIIDDNDVTIAGHPSQYLKGYDLTKTLLGHGLKVLTVQGEDYDALWAALCEITAFNGPAAVVCKRLMAPGVRILIFKYRMLLTLTQGRGY